MTTVLVVDDHAINREFLATLLGYRGYRMLEAGDGAEALMQVRQEHPDLVIADILMPTMDGYEFVRQLRADLAIAQTPVIFYTATYHEREARALAESCGVAHVLTKPSDPELVLQTVEQVLEDKAMPPAAPKNEDFHREHLRLVTDKLTRLADDLGTANQRFGALIDINLRLASERDPKLLLDSLCRAARGLIGAKYGVLAVGNRNAAEVSYSVSAGIEAALAGQLDLKRLDQGRVGEAYKARQSLRLANPGGDPTALGLPAGHPHVHSALIAPIVSLKHIYGWICLTDRIGDTEFGEEDERLLAILAAQVGRIYENGSLYVEIQKSEERFRQLAENIHEVFFLTDPTATKPLYVSPAYEDIWGRKVSTLYDDPGSWTETVHADDRERVNRILGESATTGSFDLEYRITRPDGALRWIHARGFPIRDESGTLYRVAGIAEDVTEQHRTSDKIRRLNRVYAVLSGINAAIVRIRDRQVLFEESCRILIDHGEFDMAWIGLMDPETLSIAPSAWRGPESDRDLVSKVTFTAREEAPEGRTTVGTAARERRAVVSNDLGLEGNLRPVFLDMVERGYRSVISLPLLSGGSCLGVLALYSKEPGIFDEEETKLLLELADDISFALDYIRNAERVAYLAYHDPLTGLANRAMLRRRLTQVMDDIRLRQLPFALMLININNFRDINDTLGHQNGDILLKTIAERLSSALWESDVVACLGGDEFAVLLPHLADRNDIEVVTRKVTAALQRSFMVQGLPVNVEARIGIALYPDHGNSADLLWQHADIALRAAKDLHRMHLLYSTEVDHYDPKQLALLGGLRDAIDRNELVLHYQPKISLKTGHTTGVEALLRWQHPERGLIFPDAFIPLVERTGLIDALTTWVLGNALRQGHAWHTSGLPLDLSVNLSARNLQDPNLSTEILDLVRSSQFPLDRLTLEITESAIMTDPARAKAVLAVLYEGGIRFSMDDFGIGQSSLTYLKDLPISKMKIDKSFVMDFADPRNAAIVRSAIELGHNLGLGVIAEGVENRDTCEALKNLGCDTAQGYFFSKPLPVDRLTVWLRQSDWKCASP